ncbi:MAG: hypothetical protein NVS3B3_12340 [Aquirhabdus sp.]
MIGGVTDGVVEGKSVFANEAIPKNKLKAMLYNAIAFRKQINVLFIVFSLFNNIILILKVQFYSWV